MDIPNLSQSSDISSKPSFFSVPILIIVFSIALLSGFIISRFFPFYRSTSINSSQTTISADKISGQQDIKVGQTYGNLEKTFKDTAVGTIQSGGINGEGTHTLARDGGANQNAALTSSSLDLDLFIGKRVEVKGETNSSRKAGWLLDVGTVKVLE